MRASRWIGRHATCGLYGGVGLVVMPSREWGRPFDIILSRVADLTDGRKTRKTRYEVFTYSFDIILSRVTYSFDIILSRVADLTDGRKTRKTRYEVWRKRESYERKDSFSDVTRLPGMPDPDRRLSSQ